MTGGQNHVVFWTLEPNLSSRLGKATAGSPTPETIQAEQQPPEAERAPASNEAVSVSVSASASASANASVFSSAEKAMAETFTCGVAIGSGTRPVSGSQPAAEVECVAVAVAVTGTASGAFAVWENFECVKMVQEAHGATAVDF